MEMKGWAGLKSFALSLELPEVTEAVSWGNPNLKAHGKMWCWWAPHVDANAPAFKSDPVEMEFLLDVRGNTFFTTAHHKSHTIILMRPGAFDADWARANLIAVWQKQAPKRWLKSWSADNPGHPAALSQG
ncbi:MAG: MmcQ/YjbR family DNA-binding protein [Pseudomonadota bacterium]